MSLIDTLEYFIDDVGQHLEDLAWEISEETNYDDEGHQERMDDFCEQYDEHKERLEDLKTIKSIIEAQQ
jgi:arginyl-tRNA synthetase